jgi:mono/diheme cytochrome c family protein
MGSNRRRRYRGLLAAGLLACAVACGGSSSGQSAQSSPSGDRQPPPEKSVTAGRIKVDLAKIFPPGPGRELVLANCQNCHTFAPIVLLQMDKDAWHRNSLDHRERVTTLSDEEFSTLYAYLTANFGPDHPVPDLPKEFLKSWTSY